MIRKLLWPLCAATIAAALTTGLAVAGNGNGNNDHHKHHK